MNRPSRMWSRLLGALNVIGIAAVAVLYGAAYGCIGFYIGLALDAATNGDGVVLTAWLFGWVAVGTVLLTLWTLRFTGLGAQIVIRQPKHRRYPTCTRRWPKGSSS